MGLLVDHAGTVVAAAVALLLIGFSQTAGDARAFAAKHNYQIDINQESVAQALANTGAGLFQGMPVSTSLSASSLNDHSGAKTVWPRSSPVSPSCSRCCSWLRCSRACPSPCWRP